MGHKVISLQYVRHNSNNNMMGTQLNDMIIETIIENILLTMPANVFNLSPDANENLGIEGWFAI